MDNLSLRIDRYIHLCRERLQPLLDRQPWSEVAVNPAPVRAVFAETEASGEFREAARALDALAGGKPEDSGLAFEGPSRCRHDWHLRAFLWNVGVYDSLICSQPINGDQVVEMLIREMGRTDTVFTHAAFLEGLECQAEIDAGGFNIRHLAHQEIHELFAGRSGLDRCYTESAIQEALGAEWFAVVRGPARPFEDRIVFEDDAIGLHDFTCTPFRDINLGLNLFKAAPGPVVIRQTFHWNSSLFHRRVREYPRQSNDLFPSSWGGSDGPLPMRLYRLNADDGHRLPLFWNEFKKTYIENAPFLPSYIHRAIDRFLRACRGQRTDWEFRQLLYVMALEALFSGEDEEKVRPQIGVDVRKRPIYLSVKSTVANCCANLLAPRQADIQAIHSWLLDIYSQRSRFAHGSSFKQEEFLAQPQCPGAHTEAESLCRLLKVDTSSVVEGPDIEFAVLHNVTRMALLFSIARAAKVLEGEECAEIRQKLFEHDGSTKPPQAERQRLEDRMEQIHLDAKRALVKELNDSFKDEKKRTQLRGSSALFVRWASTG